MWVTGGSEVPYGTSTHPQHRVFHLKLADCCADLCVQKEFSEGQIQSHYSLATTLQGLSLAFKGLHDLALPGLISP